jgi:hypothetical protein
LKTISPTASPLPVKEFPAKIVPSSRAINAFISVPVFSSRRNEEYVREEKDV